MERPRDEGVLDDTGRARPELHGDEAKQGPLGGHIDPDEGKGLQPERRAVQVQVEEPRHSI